MASGQEHEKATRLWSLIFGLTIGLLLDIEIGIIGGAAFAVGGFWLSPDLDIHSRPFKRWGILQVLWWPYQRLIPHRSFLSHGPIVGTSIRIIYLTMISLLIFLLLKILGLTNTSFSINSIHEVIKQNPKHITSILLGLECSAWLHLFQDSNIFKKMGRKRHRR